MTPRRIAIALIASLLAGCGTVGIEGQPPVPGVQAITPSRHASEAESLLIYYQHVKKLAGPDLGREHETARQAYTRSRSDFNRVRYAMVLSLPGAPFADEARALEMLDPVAKSPDGRLGGLAALLLSQLQERKRLDASAQGLQQKLDALRSLERSLIERNR